MPRPTVRYSAGSTRPAGCLRRPASRTSTGPPQATARPTRAAMTRPERNRTAGSKRSTPIRPGERVLGSPAVCIARPLEMCPGWEPAAGKGRDSVCAIGKHARQRQIGISNFQSQHPVVTSWIGETDQSKYQGETSPHTSSTLSPMFFWLPNSFSRRRGGTRSPMKRSGNAGWASCAGGKRIFDAFHGLAAEASYSASIPP